MPNFDHTGEKGTTPPQPPPQPQVNPNKADNGTPVQCSTWGDDAGTPGTAGKGGYTGSNGGDGTPGQDGSSVQIVVHDLLGGLNIDCRGGDGGNGAQGGQGGQGQNGGNGGD